MYIGGDEVFDFYVVVLGLGWWGGGREVLVVGGLYGLGFFLCFVVVMLKVGVFVFWCVVVGVLV